MYSLTFRVRVTTPPAYGRNGTAHAAGASIYRRRGESSPACIVCMCGTRASCGGLGGLLLGSATHFHSVAIAMQPMHRLQIRPIVHKGTSPTTLPSYIRVRAIVWACDRGQTHRHTHRHTDARDHSTFLVVYDSREM